jgi:hypothetical protein
MKIKFYLSILIVIYIILGFATAGFAYQKAEGEFILAEEEVADVEKAIERSQNLSDEDCTPAEITVTREVTKSKKDATGKEVKVKVEETVTEDKEIDPDCKYKKRQIEMDGEFKYLSHDTGDTLNAMGTFIFLFLMSGVYLFTSVFLGYAGGFFRKKQK